REPKILAKRSAASSLRLPPLSAEPPRTLRAALRRRGEPAALWPGDTGPPAQAGRQGGHHERREHQAPQGTGDQHSAQPPPGSRLPPVPPPPAAPERGRTWHWSPTCTAVSGTPCSPSRRSPAPP